MFLEACFMAAALWCLALILSMQLYAYEKYQLIELDSWHFLARFVALVVDWLLIGFAVAKIP